MFPTLSIGPAAIQTPGLILIIGLYLGISLSEKFAPKFKGNPNFIYNLVLWILLAGVLGARLSYIIQYPGIFLESPLSVISLNFALLDPLGGVLAGGLAGFYFMQKQGETLRITLDSLTPLLAVLLAALHFANLASGNAFGSATTLPWAIELWGEMRHPVQVYELAGALVILGLLTRYVRSNRELEAGSTFLLFLSASAGTRLFFDFFRGDSAILGSTGIHFPQIIAWVILASSLVLLHRQQSAE